MRISFCFLTLLMASTIWAQQPEKIWEKAVPIAALTTTELPKFPGYKSMDRGHMIPATEEAVRGYFIRRLDMKVGHFSKRTIVKMRIRFVVGVEGTVTATPMESQYEAYIIEGARVATTVLPKMSPATRKGRPVAVRYDFPLVFVARPTRVADAKSKENLPQKNADTLSQE